MSNLGAPSSVRNVHATRRNYEVLFTQFLPRKKKISYYGVSEQINDELAFYFYFANAKLHQ